MGIARRLLIVLGIFLVAGGTAAAGSGTGNYRVKLDFTNADGLVTGNDVLIHGVKAGKVESLDLGTDVAVVTVSVADAFAPLHGGTKAVVRSLGLLGNHYVEVIPGPDSGPELANGAEIDISSTTSPT
ncbi:MAG TPA: MlaD family protein, partial [Candidatus Dormibacteraeota bacterium]|nr:MlaD family protein [Candidatus Dormibacteraeota bacterium]